MRISGGRYFPLSLFPPPSLLVVFSPLLSAASPPGSFFLLGSFVADTFALFPGPCGRHPFGRDILLIIGGAFGVVAINFGNFIQFLTLSSQFSRNASPTPCEIWHFQDFPIDYVLFPHIWFLGIFSLFGVLSRRIYLDFDHLPVEFREFKGIFGYVLFSRGIPSSYLLLPALDPPSSVVWNIDNISILRDILFAYCKELLFRYEFGSPPSFLLIFIYIIFVVLFCFLFTRVDFRIAPYLTLIYWGFRA